MTRRGRLALLGVGGVTLLVAGPLAVRQVPFFGIRRIELVGSRYLPPERVLAALGLDRDHNLFDPLGEARERVAALPGVESVRLRRRVPGTLRVQLVERQPVAFVSGREGMVALDCAGRPLPFDPARSGLALPIVARADTVLVRALCAVRAGDSTLYDAVDFVRSGGGASVVLDLGRQHVRLRGVPTTDEVRAVGLVRRHLLATGWGFSELDARFAGRVYARRDRS